MQENGTAHLFLGADPDFVKRQGTTLKSTYTRTVSKLRQMMSMQWSPMALQPEARKLLDSFRTTLDTNNAFKGALQQHGARTEKVEKADQWGKYFKEQHSKLGLELDAYVSTATTPTSDWLMQVQLSQLLE